MLCLRGITKEVPDEYINYLLCKTFGWTYQELKSQPASFIEDLLLVMSTEGKVRKWQERQRK